MRGQFQFFGVFLHLVHAGKYYKIFLQDLLYPSTLQSFFFCFLLMGRASIRSIVVL